MTEIQQWFMKTNARAVFWCALIAALLVAAFWTWKIRAPVRPEDTPSQSVAKEKPHSGLGIVAFLDEQVSLDGSTPANPFGVLAPPQPFQFLKPKPPAPQKPGEHGKPPAKPPTYSLTYKGLFQRTDGKVVALIGDSNSKTKGSAFYAVGQPLHKMTITKIGTDAASFLRADGSTISLKVGIAQSFEEGKLGN